MRSLWITRDIDAPAKVLWDLLTDTEAWPRWGPSVRAVTTREGAPADSGRRLTAGATGTVTTAVGVGLPFVVTRFDDGRGWSWRVAGIVATDHSVEPLTATRCRVGFGVPWPAWPYLSICRVALGRLATMAAEEHPSGR